MIRHINAQDLFNFPVKIDYEEYSFSGVIVNPSENSLYCYIFTVKHGFFQEDNGCDSNKCDDKHYDRKIIQDSEISLSYKTDSSEKSPFDYLEFNKLFFFNHKEKSDIDFAIFVLDKKSEKNRDFLENIPVIEIMESDFNECSIVGYPKIFSGEIKRYRCDYEKPENEDMDFELKSIDINDGYSIPAEKLLSGTSGSGVFTEGNNGKIYLCGIQTNFDISPSFKCINLKTFIDEINDFLCEHNSGFEKIKTSSYSLIDKLDIKPEYFEFSSQKEILEKLKNEHIEDLVNSLQNNKENCKQFINEYSRNSKKLKKQKKDCDEILKELADAYLYRGIICHENNDSTKMFNFNMKKAEELNPKYTYSILVMKYLKDKSKLSKTQLSEIKNDIESNLKSKESGSVSDDYKISSLEALIEINKINENFSELENNYIEILSIFERLNNKKKLKENNIKQMIQYYIYLSEILIKSESFESAERYLSACIDIVNKNNDLSEFESKANELISDVLYQTGDYNKANDIYTKIYNNLNKTTDRKDDSFLMYKVEILSRLMIINQSIKPENIYKIRRIYKKAKSILADLKYKDENSKKLELRIEKTWNIANSKIIDHSIDPNESFRNEMEQKLLNMEHILEEIKLHNVDFLEKLSTIYNNFFKFFSKK